MISAPLRHAGVRVNRAHFSEGFCRSSNERGDLGTCSINCIDRRPDLRITRYILRVIFAERDVTLENSDSISHDIHQALISLNVVAVTTLTSLTQVATKGKDLRARRE
jgi:hypothetical protein